MLRIVIDVFSGRDDPFWEIGGPAARTFLERAAAAPRALNTGPAPSLLGFRGLAVEIADPAVAAAFGLPAAFRLADGQAEDAEASRGFAADLLALAPPLDGLRDHALAELPNVPAWRPDPEDRNRGEPQATGSRDAWPDNASTIADGSCEIETGRYNPVFWNGCAFWLRNNNCYAYACNMRVQVASPHEYTPQPGAYSHKTLLPSLESVRACALADGAVPRTSCRPAAERPRWLVALVFWPPAASSALWDYHWYRLQEGGAWAHKPGKTMTTTRDNSGAVITNPETCDRGRYTVWGGYLYVPVTMNIAYPS
ncbi:hypothetical protein [Oleispirillum naphthae]|uniref:hypothetical protein n=1 Tax=Oleispirillum naphthae TaxID=2838853 RepID=UPI0030824DF2